MDIDNSESFGSPAMITTQNKATPSNAFNLSISAYDDGLGDRTGMQVFAVESLLKFGNGASRIAAIKNADPNTLPSHLPLEEELDCYPENQDKLTVAWVGMLPSSADLEEKTTMGVGKGYSVNSADNIKFIETDTQAMRVVCQRGKGRATYYALISQDPKTKLCTGVMTVVDSVFFFPEFRDDDVTSIERRRKSWGAKVREACDLSKKTKEKAKRTYDETELLAESQSSSLAEVDSDDQSSETIIEAHNLRSAKRVKANLDLEDSHDILYSKPGLRHFVNATNEPPTETTVENALKDIQSMWSRVARILTTTILMQIHHCIRTSKVTTPYHHLRMFLVECARSIAQVQQPMDDTEAARIAYATEQHVLLLIDDDEVVFQEPDFGNDIEDIRDLDS